MIINARSEKIIERFSDHFSEFNVIFGAEPFCWPDATLAPEYPLATFGER